MIIKYINCDNIKIVDEVKLSAILSYFSKHFRLIHEYRDSLYYKDTTHKHTKEEAISESVLRNEYLNNEIYINEEAILYSFDKLKFTENKLPIDYISTLFNKSVSVVNTGHFLYPKNGYMGWHTNGNAEGIRMYVTYANKDNKSFFRYYDAERDEVITDYDKKGWVVRLFNITHDKPFWHCVSSECDRISIGYTINIEE